jgi:hypothetical protein
MSSMRRGIHADEAGNDVILEVGDDRLLAAVHRAVADTRRALVGEHLHGHEVAPGRGDDDLDGGDLHFDARDPISSRCGPRNIRHPTGSVGCQMPVTPGCRCCISTSSLRSSMPRPGLSVSVMKPSLTIGLGQAGDDVVPPRHVDRVIFERQEVLGRGRDMRRRHRGDRALGHVDGHGDAVVLRRVADLLGLEDAAGGQQVGMDDRDAGLEQRLEAFLEVDVLAGADRHRGRFLQLPVLLGVLPGDHVLEPGRGVFLDALREADAVCSEMWPT